MLVPLSKHAAKRRWLRFPGLPVSYGIAHKRRPQIGSVAASVCIPGRLAKPFSSDVLGHPEIGQPFEPVERRQCRKALRSRGGNVGFIYGTGRMKGRTKGRFLYCPTDADTPFRPRLLTGAQQAEQRHEGERIVGLQPVKAVD